MTGGGYGATAVPRPRRPSTAATHDGHGGGRRAVVPSCTTVSAPDISATPATGWRWRASGWIHLGYLVSVGIQPVFDPAASLLDWLLVAGVAAAFIPLYVVAELRIERARWWFSVPVTLLGIVATPPNTGASVLFVYVAAVVGVSESRRDALRWLVGLTVLVSVLTVGSTVPMPWRLWGLVPLLFIWVIGLMQIDEAAREREAAELRARNGRIGHLATVAERERIARDLHDLLGHSLTGVVMRAQLVGQLTGPDPDRARAEAAEIERIARSALTEVRRAVSGWRQASLDAELEAAGRALAAAGVELTVRRDPGLVLLGAAEHELALALREATTNVARHAGARTCRVAIQRHADELRMVVADDGVGGNTPAGGGLSGMHERIAALGGRVVRTGTAGTTVTVAVSLGVAT